MGSIAKRPDGKWRARYRDPAGKEHSRHFPRKIDAQRWLATVQTDILRGTYVDPKAGLVPFRDYAEEWRLAQMHRPTTSLYFETMLRRHAYPTFGERPLSSIRPSEVQLWVRKLSIVLAPATVKVVHGIVASIFKTAIRDRRVIESPCVGTRLPKVEPNRVEPMGTEQLELLIGALPERFRALAVLGAGSGVRQGEALGLTVDRIDFLRRTVRVDRQLVLVQGHDPFLAAPKTSASHRTIPLPRIVVDVLAEHLAAFPPVPTRIRVGGPEADYEDVLLVFVAARGGPIRRTAFGETWRPAAAKAGLPTGTGFHALRHYYASLLIRHGESVKTVQARLGHATAVETLDTYSHLWPDSEDRTREAVDSVLGAADWLRTGHPSDPQTRRSEG
jgi:integrase